jgi:hypothetical protein
MVNTAPRLEKLFGATAHSGSTRRLVMTWRRPSARWRTISRSSSRSTPWRLERIASHANGETAND